MNIIITGSNIDIQAVIRECTPVNEEKFLFEFRFPGGKLRYGTASAVTYTDNDTPVTFAVIMDTHTFVEKEQAELSIYHFPGGYGAAIAYYQALQTLQTSDTEMSLKTKINGALAFSLVYRGLVYCTNETVYYPYNPIEGDFETIEKAATIYKTR